MIKKSLLLALTLILILSAILSIINLRIEPTLMNTQGGIWKALGNSITYATGFIIALFTISNFLVGLSGGKASQNENATYIHQLSETEKDFTGRERQLGDLEKQFLTAKTNVCGICGMGGMGKTTFAIAFANKISKKFDAELFLDMGAFNDKSVTPEEAMLHVMRSFNPTYPNQENKSLLLGAFRSLLKDKKVLLLLDNVKDETQIQDLIPPASSFLIYTSRQKISLSNGFYLDLPLMTEGEAIQLLQKITNRLNSTESNQIAKLCGYLPNALVKAGNSLVKYQDLDVNKYIIMLSEAKNRVGLVEASTSLSYNLLTDQLKTSWRLLSIFPDNFGEEAASFVLGCSIPECQRMLKELLNLSLINIQLAFPSVPNEFDIAEYRFRFHDLDRLFARSKTKDNERKITELSLAEYYSTVLNTISTYFDRSGVDFLVSLSAFDREWINIEYAQNISAKYWKVNERAAEICLNYCLNSVKILDIRLPKNIIIEWSKMALRITRRKKDLINEGNALNNLGTAYSDLGEIDQAIPLLSRSIEIAEETNMPQAAIYRLDNLGNAYRRKGDTEKALEYHLKAHNKAKELNDEDSKSSILANIGNVYRDMEDLENALRYHQLGLKMAREKGNKVEEINGLLNLAADYVIQGNLFTAAKNNWLALKLSRKLRSESLESFSFSLFRDMLSAIGLNYSARKKYFRNIMTFQNTRRLS